MEYFQSFYIMAILVPGITFLTFHVLAQMQKDNTKARLTCLGLANGFGAFGSIFLACALFDTGVRLEEHAVVIYSSESANIQRNFFNGIAGLFGFIALFCTYKAYDKFRLVWNL